MQKCVGASLTQELQALLSVAAQELVHPVAKIILKLAEGVPIRMPQLLADISKHGMKAKVSELDLIIVTAKLRVAIGVLIPELIERMGEDKGVTSPTASALAKLSDNRVQQTTMIATSLMSTESRIP